MTKRDGPPYIRIVTVIEFDSNEDLDFYLASDEQAKLTGFVDEVKTALQIKKPFNVKTDRPKYGAVTASYINASYEVDTKDYES